MPKQKRKDWQLWHEEIKRAANRDSEGFRKDMAALADHIKKLREVCPKDSAGYPPNSALTYLSRLQYRLDDAKRWLAAV